MVFKSPNKMIKLHQRDVGQKAKFETSCRDFKRANKSTTVPLA